MAAIDQLYRARLQRIFDRIAKDKQKQDEADRDAYLKHQQDIENINFGLSVTNAAKNLRETIISEMMDKSYGKKEDYTYTKGGIPIPQKRFQYKEDAPWYEDIFLPLEKTEGYEEYLSKDKAIEEIELPPPYVQDPDFPGYLPEDQRQQIQEKEPQLEAIPLTKEDVPIPSVPDVMSGAQNKANEMLVQSGVILPEGMSQDIKNEILDSLDSIVKEGDSQEYKAFTNTLKEGLDNPDTLPAIVKDLTENTDQTISAVIEGTYIPDTGDASYVRDILEEEEVLEEFIGGEEDLLFGDPGLGTAENVSLSKEPLYTPEYTSEQLEDYQTETQRIASKALKDRAATKSLKDKEDILETTTDVIDLEEPIEALGETKYISDSGKLLGREEYIQELKLRGIIHGGAVPPSSLPYTWDERSEYLDQDVAPPIDILTTPDVDIPDAEPGAIKTAGKYAGKTLNALQTINSLRNIGLTIADEDATAIDKTKAGLQGTKLIADMAAKRAATKTGKKAFQTVGGKIAGGAGGILGGYEMVTEGIEAAESWEEEDYDEAVLHGIGSVFGGMQMAGGGMVATGVGAPLGAILYAVGTAGSVINSGALFLEDLFGKKEEVEAPKQKFDMGMYLDSIRGHRR